MNPVRNNRFSFGGQRLQQAASEDQKPKFLLSRNTLAPQNFDNTRSLSFNRASLLSLAPKSAQTTKKQELKNYIDKSSENEIVNNIFMFLISSDQFKLDKAFSKHSIKNPSSKSFQTYFIHLVRMLDNQMSDDDIITIMKEDLSGFMRSLGYPYTLKENLMHTFATPSSWPQLLAILDWLIFMIKYLGEQGTMDSNSKEKDVENDLIEDCILKRYFAEYNENAMVEERHLNAAFEYFAEETSKSKANASELESRKNLLKAQLETLKGTFQDPNEERGKLAKLEEEISVVHEQIQALKREQLQLGDTMFERKNQLHHLKHMINMVTQEGEDLTHKIQNQELTVDEYKNMEEEIQSLIPALGHVKAQRQEKNQAFKKTEERINELTKQIQSMVDNFNKMIPADRELHLKLGTLNLKLNFECFETIPKEELLIERPNLISKLISIDLTRELKPKLQDLRGQLQLEWNFLENENIKLASELQKLEDSLREFKEENNTIKRRQRYFENLLEEKKNEANEDGKKNTEKLENVNKDIQAKVEQKQKILQKFSELSERFEQKEAMLKVIRQQNDMLKQEVEELLRSDTLFALNHKRTIEKELDEYVKRAEKFLTVLKEKYPLQIERKTGSPSEVLDSLNQETELDISLTNKENHPIKVMRKQVI